MAMRSLKDMHEADAAETLKDAVSARSGRSKSELFDELQQLTQQERAAGRLDNSMMADLYAKLSPMLTDEQREKMREVLARLRS